MNFKRKLLPLYAIVAIFAFGINYTAIAMDNNTAEHEQANPKIEQPEQAPQQNIANQHIEISKIREEIRQLTQQALQIGQEAKQDQQQLDQKVQQAKQDQQQIQQNQQQLDQHILQVEQQAQQIQQNQQQLEQHIAAQGHANQQLQQLQQQIDDLKKNKQNTEAPKKNGKLNFDFKKLVNSPYKVALLSLIVPFGRLMHKDEPADNPLDFTTGAKGLVTINPFSKAYYINAWRFIDDCLIGFKGKKRGFFQVGASRIGYDGQKITAKEITRPVANGTATEKVTYSTYGNAYPYGLMGNFFAYFLGTGKANDLKDSIANAEWAHKTIN